MSLNLKTRHSQKFIEPKCKNKFLFETEKSSLDGKEKKKEIN